jgi:hypothetical protein
MGLVGRLHIYAKHYWARPVGAAEKVRSSLPGTDTDEGWGKVAR